METDSDRSSLLLELPECVLVELLLKVPVESLIILRSVCKLLHTYISSESFSRFHLQRWGNRYMQDTKNVFVSQDFAPNDPQYVSRGQSLCMKLARMALDPRRPGKKCRFLFQEDRPKLLQCGGCYDGILCFYELDQIHLVIYICNPALNQCRLVLKPRKRLYRRSMTRICLVHDPASEDYKVILVSVRYRSKPKVYVYSVNDCCWTQMDRNKAGSVPPDVDLIGEALYMSDLVVQNGRVYWMSTHGARGNGHRYNVLNVLDLHQESVREIALPHELRYKTIGYGCFRLIRHEGSLGVCWMLPSRIIWGPAELCVMKEEENNGISWGEPIRINLPFPGNFKGVTCKMPRATTSWGYLLSSDKNRPTDYVMVNVGNTESLGSFSIPEFPSLGTCVAIDYVPSLVSIMPAHLNDRV